MFQILVVEDDTNTRKLMTAVLKEKRLLSHSGR